MSLYVDQRIRLSSVVIKVGMVGDSQIGKTSLMVKYVEGSFDEVWRSLHSQVTFLAHHAFPVHSGLHSDSRYATNPSSLSTFDVFIASGVNFMEKTISVRRTTITFSIWDLGGQFRLSLVVGFATDVTQ